MSTVASLTWRASRRMGTARATCMVRDARRRANWRAGVLLTMRSGKACDCPSRLVAGLAQMLAAVHADRLAGHGDGALHEKQRRDRNVLRPDAALERILHLRRRQ